jgi:DNA-binding GntR family transcriptional regulator
MNVIRSKTIFEQVNEILRERIRQGEYSAGSRLPSESELSEEFNVSRATIRTVLARLAAEGLILRKQGDGTYVNESLQDVNAHLGGLTDFVRLIESSGHIPSIRALSSERRTATPEESRVLGLEEQQEVISLLRLLYAGDTPVILANNVFAVALFLDPDQEINLELPIQDVMRRYCRQEIAYAVVDIRAAVAGGRVAAHLRRPPDSPLLKIESTLYNNSNRPLVYGLSYFDDAALKLRLVQSWA